MSLRIKYGVPIIKTNMNAAKKHILNWVLFITFSAVVLILSVTSIDAPVQINHIDLVAHCIFYLIYAILFCRVLKLGNRDNKTAFSIVAISVSALYGGLMELFQAYTPMRDPSLSDIIANTVGACLGVIIYLNSHPILRR